MFKSSCEIFKIHSYYNSIFPIVFSNEYLEISAGPGLIFETLPVAFYSLPFGAFFSIMFFILISIAALSSSISLLEPFTAWIEERKIIRRKMVVLLLGLSTWILGLGSIFSFNVWSEFTLSGLNFLELLDYLTNNIMLPLGGFLVTILVGWLIPEDFLQKNIKMNYLQFSVFKFFLKYISAGSILLIFFYSVL